MNIAIFHFNNQFIKPLLNRIIKDFGFTNVYNFWILPLINDNKDITVKEGWKDIVAVMANNKEIIDFNKLIPVDKAILKKLAPYEHMSKKMLLRYTKILPEITRGNRTGINRLIDDWFVFTGNKYSSDSIPYYELNNMYLRYVRYWNDFFSKNKIDFIWFELVPHGGPEYIAYNIAKLYGIPTLMSHYVHGTAYQWVFNDLDEPFDYYLNHHRVISSQDITENSLSPKSKEEFLRASTPAGEQKVPWLGNFEVMEQINITGKEESKEKHDTLFEISPYLQSKPDTKTRISIKLASMLSNFFKDKGFKTRQEKFYKDHSENVDLTKKYIYVALHYQPELTSQPLGDYYENQLLVIQMLRYYIPEDWYIYVKEHNKFSNTNNRPIEFYEELLGMNNVKLVKLDMGGFSLIENCAAVAAVTGTSGWEGLFKNKPFLMFGYHVLQNAPGVFKINSNEDLVNAIEKIKQGVNIKKEDLLKYLKTVEDVTLPVNTTRYSYHLKGVDDKEYFDLLYKGFKDKISATLKK